MTSYGDNRVPPPGPDRQGWAAKPTRSPRTSSPTDSAPPDASAPSPWAPQPPAELTPAELTDSTPPQAQPAPVEQPTQWTPTVPAPRPAPHTPQPPRAPRPAPPAAEPSAEPFAEPFPAAGRSRRGPLLLAAGLVAALLVGTFVVVALLRPGKHDTAASAGGTSRPTATSDAGALANAEQGVAGTSASPSPSSSPPPSSSARPSAKASAAPSLAKTMPTRDDFTAATLDTTMWKLYGAPFSSDMVRVSGGELQLLGVGQDPTGATNKSGGMCWCPNSDHKYGIWQLRARFDAGAGYRPVIQLWPASNNSTTDGAIDFANDSDAARTVLNVSMHPPAGGTAASGSVKGDFTAWHVYRVEWRATFVRMYLDGTVIFDSSTSTTPLAIPSAPMHLTIQEDKGPAGSIPSPNAQTPVPEILHIDWVSYDP